MKMSSILSTIVWAPVGLAVSRGAKKPVRKEDSDGHGDPPVSSITMIKPAASQFDSDDATRRFLIKVMLPLLVVPGVVDWYWHRQTKIETTSGTKESLSHILMMGENSALLTAGLFLEMNAANLALMSGLAIAHEATAIWDVSTTISERTIYPREQHTHSFMESIPFLIASFAICFHPNQFLALFGAGPEKPRLKFRLKQPPLPLRDVLIIFGTLITVGGLPLAEELWRCFQAQRKGLVGKDTPPCLPELFVRK
jgi:hypothetical protein